jgi:co-chaperonin GroES (HSP10)
MIQAPFNKVIVQPKTKYISHISDIMKRSAIQNGATVDPADIVNIVGEIVSIPQHISDTPDYQGYTTNNLEIGDIAIFSFKVIYDLIIKQENGEPVYKNLIKYNGKEFFSCDIRNLFGVIRGEEIIMVNGNVMLEEYEKDMIIMSQSLRKHKKAKSSRIIHIGESKTHIPVINAKQGDLVFFNADKAQHYQINNKKFIILQQDKILGKEIME